MQLVKKLGAKQILGTVKNVVKDQCPKDGDTYKAYSVYGIANGIKTGTSNFGEWCAFQGKMEAVNYVTGESFAAPQCFIPEPLQSMLRDALAENDTIEFAFSVHVKRRDDLKEGYEYIVEPHKAAQEADPLAALRNLLPAPPATAQTDIEDVTGTPEQPSPAGKKGKGK